MASGSIERQFITKSYTVASTSIASKACANFFIDDITGYMPIGCFYDANDSATTISPLSPHKRGTNQVPNVQIYNSYTTAITTSGTLYVVYMKI